MRNIRSVAMAFPLAALVFASIGVLFPLSVAAAPCATTFSAGKTTLTFCYTGVPQTWKVPAGVSSATFSVSGAQGGAGANSGLPPLAGGLGGRADLTLAVVPGSTITIVIGGQGATPPAPDGCLTSASSQIGGAGGFNGGGSGGNGVDVNTCGGSGGGGASDVRIGGNGLANRTVVGGGGGGASQNAAGGAGGGTTGGNGADSTAPGLGGKGGTLVAGGAGGFGGGNHGVVGSSGVGGAGGVDCGPGGGGGGGGWFGGGGGGAQECGPAGGGGGGSGKDPSGVRAGNGIATVTFAPPLPATSASAPPIPWLPIGGLAVGLAIIFFGLRRRATV